MGLAASQARYLALTARKTNVEFWGQQINQQRTLLATESANMYNELLALPVPTAPSESDYTKTTCEFSKKADDTYEYEFDTGAVSMNADGTYNVPLTRNVDGNVAQLSVSYATTIDTANNKISLDGTEYNIEEKKIPNSSDDVTTVTIDMLSKSNSNFQPDEESDETKVYTFTMDGQTYYVSQIDYKNLSNLAQAASFRPTYVTQGTVEQSGTISAYLTKNSSGRYEAITVAQDYSDLGLSKGQKFELNTVAVTDDAAYEEAMRDYEYEKAVYDKTIEEINEKTRTIQIQDRTLELKLRQLDTEQETLKTELDSVKDVIKDSCERIFKTFQSS